MTNFPNMNELLSIASKIQTEFQCCNCKVVYPKKWCKDFNTRCLFCKHYLIMPYTYKMILKDIDWQFIKSGETSREEFYTEFINNLKKWCNQLNIIITKKDLEAEKEMYESI